MFALGRFADVRAALRNDEVFRSGAGVAANRLANWLGRDTTLSSDGDTHTTRRNVLKREFEASREFASHLPLTIVADLVGVRGDATQLLKWAAATFEALGPLNRRGTRAGATALSLWAYTQRVDAARVAPGSWAALVFEARDRGELTTREAKALVIDFVAPALDTTILASTHLLWALANNPGAWAQIRANPALIPAAVLENVRLASPIRGFTRTVATTTRSTK